MESGKWKIGCTWRTTYPLFSILHFPLSIFHFNLKPILTPNGLYISILYFYIPYPDAHTDMV